MRSILRNLSNIEDGGFSTNSDRFQFLIIFVKSSILDVWEDSKFPSEASKDVAGKAPSQMFERVLDSSLQPLTIFAEVLAIVLDTLTVSQ